MSTDKSYQFLISSLYQSFPQLYLGSVVVNSQSGIFAINVGKVIGDLISVSVNDNILTVSKAGAAMTIRGLVVLKL